MIYIEKKFKKSTMLICGLYIALGVQACNEDETQEGLAGTDIDSDGDTGTDSDADADADTGSEADADSDEADTGVGSDADSDADEADTGTGSDADSDADGGFPETTEHYTGPCEVIGYDSLYDITWLHELYGYDDKSYLIRKESDSNPNGIDGSADGISEFENDASGRPIRERVDYNADGVMDVVFTHSYDEMGREIRGEADVGLDGTLDRIYENEYSENGQIIAARSDEDADGTWDTVKEWTYDSNGNLVFNRTVNSNGEFQHVYIYTYDENNRILKKESDLENDGFIDETSEYSYELYDSGALLAMHIDSNSETPDGSETTHRLTDEKYNTAGVEIESLSRTSSYSFDEDSSSVSNRYYSDSGKLIWSYVWTSHAYSFGEKYIYDEFENLLAKKEGEYVSSVCEKPSSDCGDDWFTKTTTYDYSCWQ